MLLVIEVYFVLYSLILNRNFPNMWKILIVTWGKIMLIIIRTQTYVITKHYLKVEIYPYTRTDKGKDVIMC